MVGRVVGASLLRYVAPERLLALYSLMVVLLLGVAIGSVGRVALAALMGSEFFMSIMFPTIFSLSVRGLGNQTKLGASLLVMAVAGGAVFPALMGYVSDRSDIYTAYLVPLGCFTGVFAYACLVIGQPWKQPAPGSLPHRRAKHDRNSFSGTGR
jgi:FHS family L-fucose permease-like MFS transporter